MSDPKIVRQNIHNFLSSHGIMTLATTHKDQPWVCTVYYAVDDNLNLIILTDPNSRHGKEMLSNPKVAFSVFDSSQTNSSPVKIGIQGSGEIKLIKGLKQNAKALLLWHKANPGKEKDIPLSEIIKTASDSRMFIITPKTIKHFNKSLYPKTKYQSITLIK